MDLENLHKEHVKNDYLKRSIFLIASFIFLLACCLFDTYHSTDFEVHRNWKAITFSESLNKWYFQSTSPWTLDYPPFFAYFEAFQAQIANLYDRKIVNINSLNYADASCVDFMRATVIFSTLLFFYASFRAT